MRRHNQRVFRVARAIVKDEAEAEDVMQQAYVNAYTHLHRFQERASFGTWLTRIAVHEALARRRQRARFEGVDAAMADHDENTVERLKSSALSPEDEAMRGEMRLILEAAVDALPEIYRVVFLLREVEALSTAEAAWSLGISEDTVKTRLLRARAMLRQEIFERAGVTAAGLFPLHLSRCDRVVAGVLARLSLPRPLPCGCPDPYCEAAAPAEDAGPARASS
jgi:RNA polymerase sigma-70 factor (ECF subfamily)